MIMEKEVNRASGTASDMQLITGAGCLGTGHSAENSEMDTYRLREPPNQNESVTH